MKIIHDLPLLFHTSREISETEDKKWFSQCSKAGQCRAPQEPTQLWADWHKSSQASGNVWLGEVQTKLWESGRLTHPTAQPAFPAQFSSSIFPYHVPSQDSVLLEPKTNISRKNRCQKSRVTSPGTSLLQEAAPSLPLFLPMVWRAQMPAGQNTTSTNFSASHFSTWDGEVDSPTYNPIIE